MTPKVVVATLGWEWDPAGLSAGDHGTDQTSSRCPARFAIKVGWVRSYAQGACRRGRTPAPAGQRLPLRDARVASSRDHAVDIDVVVDCSSGTYIRALARDLGAALGSADHLRALRRTAIGPIGVGECRVGRGPRRWWSREGRVPAHADDDGGRRCGLGTAKQAQGLFDETDGVYVVMDADSSWVSVVSIRQARTRIGSTPPPSPTVPGPLTKVVAWTRIQW